MGKGTDSVSKQPRDNYKEDAERYLRDTADAFFFDPQSGIHQPKAYETRPERADQKTNPNPDPVWRFWVTTIVSVLSLIGLAIYAYYAALQWSEMKRAADATRDAANAATRSANTASDSALLNRQLAEGTQPAIIAFEVMNEQITEHDLGFKIYFTNTGHIAAQDFTADVTITKESMIQRAPIGKPSHWKVPKTIVPPGAFGEGPNKDTTVPFDIKVADPFKQTVKVEADISYNNGFGRVVAGRPCKTFVTALHSAGWINCQDVDAYVKKNAPPK